MDLKNLIYLQITYEFSWILNLKKMDVYDDL